VGRDIVIGIATRYGLDGPGIESRWQRVYPHPSRPDLGPANPASYKMGTGSFTRLKRPRRVVNHPHPSSAAVKIELYLYSPYRPSWPVLGRTLPLPFTPTLTSHDAWTTPLPLYIFFVASPWSSPLPSGPGESPSSYCVSTYVPNAYSTATQ
jgi:hypothetical protein